MSDIQIGRTPRERLPRQRPPRDGEIILSCGHGPSSPIMDRPDNPRNPSGWFELMPPAVINGPTGQLESRWISCCTHCFEQAHRDPRRVQIRTHFPFAGATDGPVVDIAQTRE